MKPENMFDALARGALKVGGFSALCVMIYADILIGVRTYEDLANGNIVTGLSELLFVTTLTSTVPVLGYALYKA